MLRTFFMVVLSLLTSQLGLLSAFAQENKSTIKEVTSIENITEYKMDNGLKILLYPDPSTSKVTVNATVFVGSRHEGYGEGGMAHLLEHMVFKGTKLHPDIPKALKDRGAIMNGTTWVDRTNYFETLSSEGDNLEFAIRLEADRLFNSFIRREDLLSEMTVVRNEFERGENDPVGILSQRMLSAAYDWHNYGKSTIGNRADIERVPIDKLQGFYKKYYRIDNIMLVIAGNFKKEQALALIGKYFGPIQKPDTPLESTYTEEPPQDGQRQVVLRRVGKVGAVGVVYHTPSSSHPDFPALDILEEVLTSQPSGILYKTMVLGKVATSVSGYAFGWHDPGVFEIMASVDGTADIDKTRSLLLETIEKFRASPVDKTEVERAKTKFARSRSLLMSDSNRIGISLSDWAAKGDWRLFFLFRDLITKVTPEDVQRVAQTYLTQNNSTVGTYYPTDKAERIKIPASPDLNALLKDYKGGQVMAQGEFFDPSVENIIQSTTTGTLSPNIKYAYLPKKTRNQVVTISIDIHFGNDKDLAEKNSASAIMPLLLTRGTQKKTRQEIEDTMAKLQAQWRISGSSGELQISILCRKDAVNGVLELLHEVLHEPAFSSEELEIIKRQSKDLLEKNKTEPGALANRLLQRKLSPYPNTDVRYTPTFEESAERLNKLTIEDIKDLYKNIFGVGEAEVVAVGDFDPQSVSGHAKKILDLKSKVAFKKIEKTAKTADKGEKLIIDTPDKENAMFMSGIVFPLKDSDPDFVGLAMADFIIGSGSLSSRLGNRVRQKEGLAYGVRSGFDADAEDLSARFMVMASCNPSKIKNVDVAVFDEIKKFIDAGIDATEFAEGQKAFLAQMKIERTTDSRLASILAENLTANRSMEFYKSLELKIKNLTSKEVVDAFKKHVTADKMITIWAGDFNKKN